MTEDRDPVESITASHLVTSAPVASLIPTMVEHDVLSAQDAREVYEHALLLIEMKQDDDHAVPRIWEAARELIEAHLRSERKTPPDCH